MRIIGGRQSWLRMPERLKTSPYGTGKQAIGSRLGPRAKVGNAPAAVAEVSIHGQLTAARIQAVRDHMRLECERDFDRRAVITALGLDRCRTVCSIIFRLTNTAGKSFSKSLASECFRDEVNKDPCLRRH